MKRRRGSITALGLLGLVLAAFALVPTRFAGVEALMQRLRGQATVADRLAQYGPTARLRWQPHFEWRGLSYPPTRVVMVGLKAEKRLEVYAIDDQQAPRFVRAFPVLAASGKLGPKLAYGDRQVPEGLYGVEWLNPNSAYHLSFRLSYPNASDRSQAFQDGRTELGGDIMIHGSNRSVGCLAMGDQAAEDLFVLVADVGASRVEVILSPVDFRRRDAPPDPQRPAWVSELYGQIKAALLKLPAP